jgi:hypothetical protein
VLAYLVVFAMTIGTTLTFGLALALSTESYTQRVPGFCQSAVTACPEETFRGRRSRPDRVWWLLAPNPFVILADAAPHLPAETAAERQRRQALEERGVHVSNLRDSDPLSGLGNTVRDAHKGPGAADGSPIWPWGLGFDVLVGAGALWLTAHRLRTPTRSLPLGQRVA